MAVRTRADYRRSRKGVLGTMVALAYGLLSLTIVIAVLGVVNTLAPSEVERTREIWMLRALGPGPRPRLGLRRGTVVGPRRQRDGARRVVADDRRSGRRRDPRGPDRSDDPGPARGPPGHHGRDPGGRVRSAASGRTR
ncbi:hypothetical protein [Embleya hyalina]|uniref:hypothetical protein n=1 Tax=Embleya hyalina TaxID=516124 RepID=UPI000F827F80|nr:hypothetical protein [Embleya hyalina]